MNEDYYAEMKQRHDEICRAAADQLIKLAKQYSSDRGENTSPAIAWNAQAKKILEFIV